MNRRSFRTEGEAPPSKPANFPNKPLPNGPPNRRSIPAEVRYAPRGRPLPDDGPEPA